MPQLNTKVNLAAECFETNRNTNQKFPAFICELFVMLGMYCVRSNDIID